MIRYLIILLLLSPVITISQEENGESITDIFSNYFSTENIINKNLFGVYYGPEQFDFQEPLNNSFERNYTTQIDYGFYRYDRELSENGILYYSSEKVFFGNSSSRFKLEDLSSGTIKSEIYRYGASYMNGFGYGVENSDKFLFSHESGFVWSETDIEPFNVARKDIELINQYDEEHNFGMYYASGIRYSLYNSIVNLSLKYNKNVVWSDFGEFKWLGSWALENLFQRWIDFFHLSFLEKFGTAYPIIYQVYKTSISYLIYEMRSNDSNWPFDGSKVMQQESIRFGISLVF